MILARKCRKFFVLAILAAGTSGCLHVEVAANSDTLDKSKPDAQRQLPYWAGGFGVQHVDVTAACKGKGEFSQFQLKQRFLDGFLEVVTLGIYTPMTANITCNGKKGA